MALFCRLIPGAVKFTYIHVDIANISILSNVYCKDITFVQFGANKRNFLM